VRSSCIEGENEGTNEGFFSLLLLEDGDEAGSDWIVDGFFDP